MEQINNQKACPAKLERNRGFVIPLIIAIVALIAIGGGIFVYQKNISDKAPMGQRDIFGCWAPSSEHWCASQNKCLQAEEKCEVASTTTNPVACTEDAMQCPDGSYVGRSGPKCEFVCPTTAQKEIKIYARFDKTLVDSFGDNYFKARDNNGNIYKFIFDSSTTQDYYGASMDTPYQKGNFTTWLKFAKDCWSGITPEGAHSSEQAELLCASVGGRAYFVGTEVGLQTVKLSKVITETN